MQIEPESHGVNPTFPMDFCKPHFPRTDNLFLSVCLFQEPRSRDLQGEGFYQKEAAQVGGCWRRRRARRQGKEEGGKEKRRDKKGREGVVVKGCLCRWDCAGDINSVTGERGCRKGSSSAAQVHDMSLW